MSRLDFQLSLSQREAIAKITEILHILESSDHPDPLIFVLTGLSGIGKSSVVEALIGELSFNFQPSDDGELYTTVVNGIPLLIVQQTIEPSIFDKDGSVLIPYCVQNPQQEILHFPQRTLDKKSAQVIIERQKLPYIADTNTFNDLTLGVPKLIKETSSFENLNQVVEFVTWYLIHHFGFIKDEQTLRHAVSLIETQFLAQDRKIPSQILQKIPRFIEIATQNGEYGQTLWLFEASADQSVYRALKQIHTKTWEYYSQSVEKMAMGGKSFRIEAWIDQYDVNWEILFEKLDQITHSALDFSGDALGELGKLLHLFKLVPTQIGYRSSSVVGGSIAKTEFAIRIGKGKSARTITNTFQSTVLVGLANDGIIDFDQDLDKQPPNFSMKVRDHEVSDPAITICSLEAVFQSLGIRYKVLHPDGKTYVYEPSFETYQEVISPEEMAKLRRKNR